MTRLKRWLRRIGIVLAVLVVLVTIASFAYNTATDGRETSAGSLYAGPYVVADGTSIAYRRWGTTGTPIVLLGGFVEPSWVWQGVGSLLGRTHRVFALDLPPFGYTQRRGPFTLAHWVELVRAFDAKLGVRRPVLVGHSLGAAVAVASALARPRAVAGIVLLDGDALPVGGGGRWLSHLLVNPYYTSIFRIVTGSDWLVGRVLQGALAPHAGKPPRAQLELWERQFRVRGTANAFRHLFAGGSSGVSSDDLQHVRTPSLVVWGEHDTVDAVDAGRQTARALGAQFVLVRGAGHLSMLGRPVAVARAIERVAR
ncbi:MAG: alpha/beta hydrolase [Actinomycetota bacterium]